METAPDPRTFIEWTSERRPRRDQPAGQAVILQDALTQRIDFLAQWLGREAVKPQVRSAVIEPLQQLSQLPFWKVRRMRCGSVSRPMSE